MEPMTRAANEQSPGGEHDQDWRAAERLVRSLQFEGYLLYPYRRSALKNQHRWAFGTLYPNTAAAALSERARASSEVLVLADRPELFVSIRALQAESPKEPRERAGRWHALEERNVSVKVSGASREFTQAFVFEPTGEDAVTRQQVRGRVSLSTRELNDGLHHVSLAIANETEFLATDRDLAYRASLVAVHVILRATRGQFVSVIEPPRAIAKYAEACFQDGMYPVLVGDRRIPRTLVSSPIIVSDFPEIAPESPGDLYDMTEIDELLALRILTLTEQEKAEMRASDPRARELLERTEGLSPDDLLALHGRTTLPGERARFRPGDRVRISPRAGGDVLDVALGGERATVCAVERDLEGRLHFAVTIDADPGSDLGAQGLPGHRFFFAEDELERLP